jgi:hypothetical protein
MNVWNPEQLHGFLEHVRGDPLYAAWLLEHRLAVGPRWQDSGLVITWPDGRPIHPERFSRWFEQHARDAGLPKIRLPDVRHSYATAALAAGVPAKVVSERLGHATFAITMDTLIHVLPGLDAQAADTMARLILGDGEQEPMRPVDKALTIGRKASGRGEEVKGERPGRRGVRAEGFEPPRPRTPGPKPGASAGSATLASRSSSLQQRSSGSCSAKRMAGREIGRSDRPAGPALLQRRAGREPADRRPAVAGRDPSATAQEADQRHHPGNDREEDRNHQDDHDQDPDPLRPWHCSAPSPRGRWRTRVESTLGAD